MRNMAARRLEFFLQEFETRTGEISFNKRSNTMFCLLYEQQLMHIFSGSIYFYFHSVNPRWIEWVEHHKLRFWLRFVVSDKKKLYLTTVFVDTRLRKTKQPRKRFQNFSQSYTLSTDRIKIHQSQPLVWPPDLLYVMLAGCDWWISIKSVDNVIDGNFGNVSAVDLFSEVAHRRKRG